MTTIFPTWPIVPQEGIDAVTRVLSSGKINYWTGNECRQFEKEYASYTGSAYALAVSNGTIALEIALRAFGVGLGDEVIVPSRTFIATAGAVVAVGATPVIADIDPSTNCVTAETVARVLTPRTKAIIPVHLGGFPAPLDEILSLAAQVKAVVIEDCAQAHGALYHGRPVGSIGHAGCFSFCQDKILPLGEGGMIVLDDKEAYERAWTYRDHGRSWAKAHDATVGATSAQFKWLTESFGTNGRLGEIEGALGRVLLDKLPEYHRIRHANAEYLAGVLLDTPGISPVVLSPESASAGDVHAYYRLYGLVDIENLKPTWSRDRIITELCERGVPVQYGSCALIGREKAFSAYRENSELPGAQFAHDRSIAFFVHPTLDLSHMEHIANQIRNIMKDAVVAC